MTPVDELAPGGQCHPVDALQAPLQFTLVTPVLLPNRPAGQKKQKPSLSAYVPLGHRLLEVEPAKQPNPLKYWQSFVHVGDDNPEVEP
jgi:hypothetical protein